GKTRITAGWLRHNKKVRRKKSMSTLASKIVATLKWLVLALVITGGLHFTLEAVLPDLRPVFPPAALAPLLLAYGAWVGYRAITMGGGFGHAVLAGVILGVLPITLDVVGFGLILGRGAHAGLLAGILGFALILSRSILRSRF